MHIEDVSNCDVNPGETSEAVNSMEFSSGLHLSKAPSKSRNSQIDSNKYVSCSYRECITRDNVYSNEFSLYA